MYRALSIRLLLLSCVLAFATASASEAPPRANDAWSPEHSAPIPSRTEDIDDLIETAMANGHVPGLAAAIVTANGPLWFGAYGFATYEPPRPVEIGTLFMMASVSKVVTATAFMQLYEQGLVDLDDDIDTHLSFVVDNPRVPAIPVIPRMLLSHVSSIADNWGVMPYYGGDSPYLLGTYLENYLAEGGIIYDPDLNYFPTPPATEYHYSNIGLATVGHLVEAITGQLFNEYCNQSLFAPLEMLETAWHLADLDTTRLAMPYHWNGSTYVPYGHYGYSDYPSGQLRTSVDQLSRFVQAYLSAGVYGEDRILEESTIALMLTPHYPSIDATQGLAWYGDGSGWCHGGGDRGVSTFVSFNRNPGVGVLVFTNGENSAVTGYVADLLYNYAEETMDIGVEIGDANLSLTLRAPHPNPTSGQTAFGFILPSPAEVTLEIFDVHGRHVSTVMKVDHDAGEHLINWDGRDANGRDVSVGQYLARLQVESEGGHREVTRKLTVLR